MTMKNTKVVLFSEINSPYGENFFLELMSNSNVDVVALVTTQPGKLCDYFVNDSHQVNLEQLATQNNIPVYRPTNINTVEFSKKLAQYQADYFIIANYQQIFRQHLIDIPYIATINFHPTLLPAYAGLAPFFWMAKQGETKSGVSALSVNEQVDCGMLLMQIPINLTGVENAMQLREIHFNAAKKLLRRVLPNLIAKSLPFQRQDMSIHSYFSKPTIKDYLIDWSDDFLTISRTVRAAYPTPGAFYINENKQIIRVFEIECISRYDAKIMDIPFHQTPIGHEIVDKNNHYVIAKEGLVLLKQSEPIQTKVDISIVA